MMLRASTSASAARASLRARSPLTSRSTAAFSTSAIARQASEAPQQPKKMIKLHVNGKEVEVEQG